MAAATEIIKALDLADAIRIRPGDWVRPFDLWLAADKEAGGSRATRQTLFRHSMVHAGFVFNAKGDPYKRCPMCHCTLKR